MVLYLCMLHVTCINFPNLENINYPGVDALALQLSSTGCDGNDDSYEDNNNGDIDCNKLRIQYSDYDDKCNCEIVKAIVMMMMAMLMIYLMI